MLTCYRCDPTARNRKEWAALDKRVSKCGICNMTQNVALAEDPPARDPDGCVVCGKACLAICPYCRLRVHATYGVVSENCGGAHEGTCAGAKEANKA